MTTNPNYNEYLEIILKPDDKVDLFKLSSTLYAINAEYKDWLLRTPDFDHKDKNSRLFVERIESGSIKFVIYQLSYDLFYSPLFVHALEYYSELIGSLITAGTEGFSEENFPTKKRLKNLLKFLYYGFIVKSNSSNEELSFTKEYSNNQVQEARATVHQLLKSKIKVETLSNAVIKFMGFHRDKLARVVCEHICQKEVKTFLSKSTRNYFLGHDQNMFVKNKEYIVNLEVHYFHETIEHYLITDVIAE